MKKKVMLFYADWCGHCTKFKPVWENLKKDFDNKNIDYEEFEASNEEIMQKYNIEGFPTIKIVQEDQITDYSGQRDRDSILHYLGEQSGGGIDPFYKKYLKYKKKYLDLKK